MSTPEEFKKITGSSTNGGPIYLENVAEVEYGAYNEEQLAKFNGEQVLCYQYLIRLIQWITVMDRVKDELET